MAKRCIVDSSVFEVRKRRKARRMTSSALAFHTPGGHEHDQQSHAGGRGGAMDADELFSNDGIGSVPDNRNVKYLGFEKRMTPDEFLALTPRGDMREKTLIGLRERVEAGEKLGTPFISATWDEETKAWYVSQSGHEGRHRVTLARELLGEQAQIPVHIFPRDGLRARDLTPEMREARFVYGRPPSEAREHEAYLDRLRADAGMSQHDRPRSVDPVTFAHAAARVDFAVIERRHNLLSADAAEQLARVAARAVRRLLTPERLTELLDPDVRDIGELKFDSADVGKLKSGFKEALGRAWVVGQESAARELGKARQPVPATFATLRDNAADFFEANGFRMAANLTDGMRAIMQQELLLAVKNGIRPEHIIGRIYDRLIRKGFTTLLAVQREEARPEVLEHLEELLADALGVANVPAYLNTLIRTNTFEALNEARYAAYTDPELQDFVVALEYSAILDDRTTEICNELGNPNGDNRGVIYAADSEVWNTHRPPNHYNCRSLLIPITVTDNWDGVESPPPTVEPQEGFK